MLHHTSKHQTSISSLSKPWCRFTRSPIYSRWKGDLIVIGTIPRYSRSLRERSIRTHRTADNVKNIRDRQFPAWHNDYCWDCLGNDLEMLHFHSTNGSVFWVVVRVAVCHRSGKRELHSGGQAWHFSSLTSTYIITVHCRSDLTETINGLLVGILHGRLCSSFWSKAHSINVDKLHLANQYCYPICSSL